MTSGRFNKVVNMPRRIINSFRGEYSFLSNFSRSTIIYEGIPYPTVEHAYQAAKTWDIGEREKIANLPNPGAAKRAGQFLELRPGWEKDKVNVMRHLLRLKFERLDVGMRLRRTGNAILIEGNTWGDTFWGECKGVGENMLGKLLMEIRDAR